MLAAGIALDAAVLLLPLSPYPLIQKYFDRQYYEVHRGYEQFLESGKWEVGDTGFELMRTHYMRDVVRGLRPQLDSKVMSGLQLETFRIGESEEPVTLPEKKTVYVIYSNQEGHVINGDTIKILTGTFRKPYAMLVSLALLLAGTGLIYRGLSGLFGTRINAWNHGGSALMENGLSRNSAS